MSEINHEARSLVVDTIATGACAVLGLLGFGFSQFEPSIPSTVALVCFVGAYLSGGTKTLVSAAQALMRFRLNVDILMILAAIGAAILGDWAEGVVLLFLFSLSGTLERYAIYRTNQSIESIMRLRPKSASRINPESSQEEIVGIESLCLGDLIRIKPGEKVPVDGLVVEGEAWADESTLTGESTPVEKSPGSQVFAGSTNSQGSLVVKMTKRVEDFTIERTIQLVHDAQSRSSPSQKFVESWQQPYVILVLFGALITLLGARWVHTKDWNDAFYHAMVVMVASSPCAVVLSSPAVMLSAIAVAGRNGVLIKGPVFLEYLSQLDTIAFDKTGTITLGHPQVAEIWTPPGCDVAHLLRLAGLIENRSEHPLAIPIMKELERRGIALPDVKVHDFQSHTGLGVHGSVEGVWVGIGKESLFQSHGCEMTIELKRETDRMRLLGMTALPIVTSVPGLTGVIGVIDPLRPDCETTLQSIRSFGVKRLVLLTGDHPNVAKAIVKGLPLDEVYGGLLPEDKVKQISRLCEGGRIVAMVGDGVNDAPALASAQIGIAMGGAGTDVALDVADVVLMKDDLQKLPFAMWVGRVAQKRVKQNLRFAFGMIFLLLILSFFNLPLWLGVIGHEGSTLLVVFNGVRLLWEKPK